MDRPDREMARTAIENLLFSYAERIDAGDFAALGRLFSRARIVAPNGDIVGSGEAEVRALYDHSTKIYEDGSPKTQHVTTNVILLLASDARTAETRARFTVMQALPDFPLQCIIAGDYEDRFAWDASIGWHFTQRCMKPRLLGDLSRHLRYPLAGE